MNVVSRLLIAVFLSVGVCSCTSDGQDSGADARENDAETDASRSDAPDGYNSDADHQNDGDGSTHTVAPFVGMWDGDYQIEVEFPDNSRIQSDYRESLLIEQESRQRVSVQLRPEAAETCVLTATANATDELAFDDQDCQLTFEDSHVVEIDSTDGTVQLEDDDHLLVNLTATGTLDGQNVTMYVSFQ